ncbi:efflux RND transporter periplasmic adaptor subunit [Marimonas lutisalis]|uniref:efflux RND transporter periplasmic adaptor subunit n=1 Tax=Marimonas lutisalis TaxID=2545756 RepID=UPI0010F87A13|nr:efflux RND transporter periplasmic adaptor subunit [Marimonas lutisalis]
MSLWKQLLVVILLAALANGGYEGYQRYVAPAETEQASSGRRAPGPAPVEVAIAETRSLREIIEAVGTTRARQSVDIVPEASGRIEEVAITPGQRVEKGAVLVRLDDAVARADLDEANARLIERERALERVTQLRGSNAVAEATLEEAVARLAEARAQLDRAEQRLAERTIRAPFSGTVGLAEVDRGARVSAGTFITRLDDLAEVEVEFSLPETLFARIETGQEVTARSVAFPGRGFAGRVDAVDSRIDPVSRAFRARAIIPNPDGTLPAGMFMSLELVLSESQHIVVPEEAIIFQAAETYVFAIVDDKAQRVTVRTGQRRDGQVAILDGLAEGTPVVVRGLHRVRNGGAVKVLNAPEGGAASDGAGS